MERNREGLIFIISGPSGCGKTTLCRSMTRIFPNLYFSISFTTRPPRDGEANGRDYYFVTRDQFQRMIDRGEFAEWAEIYGHRYGTSGKILEEARRQSRDVILDIDPQGARQIKDQGLPGSFIFILPPSFEELARRMGRRQTESPKGMEERLQKARAELAGARGYDYLIVNDELADAEDQLKSILMAEHFRRERMIGFLENMLREK